MGEAFLVSVNFFRFTEMLLIVGNTATGGAAVFHCGKLFPADMRSRNIMFPAVFAVQGSV